MKILHTVEFYSPSVGGMQEVVKQLSERLVELGHDVTVATTRLPGGYRKDINGVKIKEFSISGNLARGMTGEIDKYRDFLINSDFDIVSNFAAQQWATDVALTVLDRVRGKKVFVPTGFSGLYAPEYKDYFESMKSWLSKYDMNVFLSNHYRDIDFARLEGVEKIVVISNGASEEEFLCESTISIRKKYDIPSDHLLILHVGSHTGLKGHREAMEIFSKAGISGATFLLVANDLGGGCSRRCRLIARMYNAGFNSWLNEKRILVESLSREETVSAYKEADLFLFPSNIECSPLVLFECMASNTPFLTTDVGNSAEIVEWSRSGMLLPTKKDTNGYSAAYIDGSVKMLENIFRSKVKRKDMAEAGFKAWQERFTWEKIASSYERLYSTLQAN